MPRASRNLVLVGLVSLLTDASTEMVFPLLPLLLTTLGAGALALGVMEGLAESVASFLKLASGHLSDRWQRRKELTIVGYAVSAVTKLGYPLATLAGHLVGLRALDRVGKGIRGAPRDALIADSMPRASWGFAFGLHRALDTIGALLGPLMAIAILAFASLESLLWAATIPGFLGVLLLFAVREPRPGPAAAAPRLPHRLDARLHSYLLTIAVFTLGNFAFVFLLLRAAQVGLPASDILWIHVTFNAVYAVLAWPLGTVTDRVGRPPILALAFGALIAASLLTAHADPLHLAAFLPLAAAFGVAAAGFEGNGRALAVDLSAPQERATVLGAYHATIGLASLPAGILMGLLGERDPQLVFVVGALFAGVALLELVWLWTRGNLRPRTDPA